MRNPLRLKAPNLRFPSADAVARVASRQAEAAQRGAARVQQQVGARCVSAAQAASSTYGEAMLRGVCRMLRIAPEPPPVVEALAPEGTLRGDLLRRIGIGVGVAAASCSPVVGLSMAVNARYAPLLQWDEAVLDRATRFLRRHRSVLKGMVVWEHLVQPAHVYVAAIPAVLWVWLGAKSPRNAIWGAATLAASWHVGLDVKAAMHRTRPTVVDPLTVAHGYSFPSGHMFHNTLVAGTTLAMMWPVLPLAGKVTAATFAAGLCTTTAVNRTLLGAHYATDVIAGAILAGAVVAGSWTGSAPRVAPPA